MTHCSRRFAQDDNHMTTRTLGSIQQRMMEFFIENLVMGGVGPKAN
jgi:hypothetical protein